MPHIKFSKEEKEHILPLLKEYLRDEMDCDAGGFEVEFLLEFFAKEAGGFIYNQALDDARALLEPRLEVLSDGLIELEKPIALKK